MEAEIPQEGDSVPNLSKCTARTLFDELRQRVENECKSASDLKFNDVSLNKLLYLGSTKAGRGRTVTGRSN